MDIKINRRRTSVDGLKDGSIDMLNSKLSIDCDNTKRLSVVDPENKSTPMEDSLGRLWRLNQKLSFKPFSKIEKGKRKVGRNNPRIGIVKVGSLPMTATPKEVQNIQCNNDCEAVIYEPYKNSHTKMSITNAQKYNLDVRDGEPYPTYANVNEVTDKLLYETISGSQSLDTNNFKLQETVSSSKSLSSHSLNFWQTNSNI